FVLLGETLGLGGDAWVSRLGRLLRFGKRLQETRQGRAVDLDTVRVLQVADDLRLSVPLLEIQPCNLLAVGLQHRFGLAAPSVRWTKNAALQKKSAPRAYRRNAAPFLVRASVAHIGCTGAQH